MVDTYIFDGMEWADIFFIDWTVCIISLSFWGFVLGVVRDNRIYELDSTCSTTHNTTIEFLEFLRFKSRF